MIVKCCATMIFSMIRTKQTLKSMWETLQRKYRPKSQSNVNLLRGKLVQIRCGDDEKLNNLSTRFELAVTNLEQADTALSEKEEKKSYF